VKTTKSFENGGSKTANEGKNSAEIQLPSLRSMEKKSDNLIQECSCLWLFSNLSWSFEN